MIKRRIFLNAFIGGLTALSLFSLPGDVSAEAKHVCSPEVKQLREQGKPLFESKNYAAVIQLMSSALNKEPGCPNALYNRALAYAKIEKYNEAAADYRKVLEALPNSYRTWSKLGNVYLNMNNLVEAERCLTQAISLNDQDVYTYYDRAKIYREQGKLDESINDFKKAIQLDPNFPELKALLSAVYFERAQKHHKQQNYEAAIADFTETINSFDTVKDFPEKDLAYCLRGSSYHRIKNFAAAIADFSKAIQLSPEKAEHKAARSIVYGYGLKDYQSAIQDMQAAMAQDSRQKNGKNYGVLTDYYFFNKDLTSALTTVNTGLAMYPNVARLYVSRGVIYINLGNKEAAYRDFSKACQLDPNNQFALKHRNGLAAQLGK